MKEMEYEPPQREETIRKGITGFLEGGPLSAKELSKLAGIPEKEVYTHLEHIQRTLKNAGKALNVLPPKCKHCGFEFRKRERLKKPGRCPVCRSSHIEGPLFSIG
ncbi:MAG: transcriptional regulator [Deltaproteobacteria bacterium]|nr:transcriptional regulator [Deltaproteobacteria bacterium]